MNLSALFIHRPVATTLLTLGMALAGIAAFFLLPVSPLPQVDFPTISVEAHLPGASPETMATSVATPLERHLGQIADVSEMTSSSSLGSTRVTLQFGLNRNIDGAARDVQAAINAARADLPTALKSNPTYHKLNPADAPIMILALTSKTLRQGQLYDVASTILQQKLSQLNGIGQVAVGGSSLPAVRVEVNPLAAFKYGIGFEDIRAALAAANANTPKGSIETGDKRWQIYTNDQARLAENYRDLVIASRNGTPVRLAELATVTDSVEDARNQGLANGEPSVVLILFRQPGANIIDVVTLVRATLPQLEASIPRAVDLHVIMDQTTTIRASLSDVERSLLIAIILVIGVVFLFLRNAHAALIPCVAVPLSLIGTFGVMYLCGYSLDNLSLMALIVSTGFVVDDAIVVLENTMRHLETGMPRLQAALQGVQEVAFTVVSMSLSLIAVFIPILLMGGIVGRLFHEFAVTLSIAILISLIVSLTTTPMMCAYLLKEGKQHETGASPLQRLFEKWGEWFQRMQDGYVRSLSAVLRHEGVVLSVLLITIVLNVALFILVPKGFFPQQDTGRLVGNIQADQSISFQSMRQKLTQFVGIVKDDPAVASVVGYTGGGQTNSGFMFVGLKPLAERQKSADMVIARLRGKTASVPGAALFLQSVQDIRMGGRPSAAQYQYTLQADDLTELRLWSNKLAEALQHVPEFTDVNSDQQEKGLETDLVIDRVSASRLGLTASQIDNTLYDAFGQRQVSTIYNPLNQYHVVMEAAPEFLQNPEVLNSIYVSTAGGGVRGTQATNAVAGTTSASAGNATGDAQRNLISNQLGSTARGSGSTGSAVSFKTETMVPLSTVSHFAPSTTPLSVNHQGHFAASTISFNLTPGKSLSDAVKVIDATKQSIGMPATVQGGFQGTAKVFQDSSANQGILILAAILAVYIVLGILYESTVHPITILSTLPSAGLGAVLALMLCGTEFSIIAMIGVILLIGIVKKNAIMMIDFALVAERAEGLSSRDSILKACAQRFRPIMMTTLAALLGALPLAAGFGEGSEMRRPLGISIMGGLLVSQLLTLYTTPVIYLVLDRWRHRFGKKHNAIQPTLNQGLAE